MYRIRVLPGERTLQAREGRTLHEALAREGLLDAPCGGRGSCGKCKVLVDDREALACRTVIDRDMTVTLPSQTEASRSPAKEGQALAFDIGTTTLVCALLDHQGHAVSQASAGNPQRSFGADVVSRIRAANAGHRETLTVQLRSAMTDLIRQLCSNPDEIQTICVVGNPAMQQLFLGMDLENLAQIPYTHKLHSGEITPCAPVLPICPNAGLLTVPDISGFVGADTVAGILACGLRECGEMTLLVDIGTNGEMVLGNRDRMLACSAAAGPALEGANISCGMRAEPGAIEKVWIDQGALRCSPATDPRGICGSGLIDAVAASLNLGLLNRRGRIWSKDRIIPLPPTVSLTQEDIRQVQLAKGAIAAGIRLMTEAMGISLSDIQRVLLAGSFGAALNPGSACRIGLLPEGLWEKVRPVGNAAAAGAVMLASDPGLLAEAGRIARETEYLDLAALPAFPRTFAKTMEFSEDWCASARALGFDHAAPLEPAVLQAREDVRAMCAEDKCHAYGKNWTCPPHCGTVAQCQERMHSHRHGILLQTVGHLSKTIDARGYRETERRHLENFSRFCTAVRRQYPDALCLGAGACRICQRCAYPAPCRVPERAVSSMEGYGLFVTQVCRDAGLPYHYGEKTITYTACVLYG